MLRYPLNRRTPDRDPASRVSWSVSPVQRRQGHVPTRARLAPGPGGNRPVGFAADSGAATVQPERSAAVMYAAHETAHGAAARHSPGPVTAPERSRRGRPGGRAAPGWRPVG